MELTLRLCADNALLEAVVVWEMPIKSRNCGQSDEFTNVTGDLKHVCHEGVYIVRFF
jgi:hypothetical protein